jgi:hypothetical protein
MGGAVDIVQTTSYYPFGLVMNQMNGNTALGYRKNKYLYNGKELQDDNMNRLYTCQVAGQDLKTINYSPNGNITVKTDAGTYSYDQAKTNAVTGLAGNKGTVSGTEQDITYTDFNMTSSVTELPYEIQYTYSPDNGRIKSVLKNNGSTVKSKYYSFGYEKETAGSAERQIHYINGPFGLEAVLIKAGETTTTYYTETDHPGSITGLINPDGTYAEQLSYDACLPVRSKAKAGGGRTESLTYQIPG